MVKDPVSQRYAEAYFESAKQAGRIDAAVDELETLAGLLAAHAELNELLLNPDVDLPDKLQVLTRVMGEVWTANLEALVRLVLSMERAAHLPEMAGAMRELVDAEQRVLRVQVRTARPLAAPLRERLVQWLQAREGGRRVDLTERVDPALLGGIEVTVGHRVFDGSLRSQLDRLRHRLKTVRVH